MSAFYKLAYMLGFKPWEEGLAQPAIAAQIQAMFDREESGREPPYGRALDLGCGTGIHAVELARRGWEVTGIDCERKAIDIARERARVVGVAPTFLLGDVAALEREDIGRDFELVVDFGTVHGLPPAQSAAAGRSVNAVTSSGSVALVLAFAPRRRGPLPRGMSRSELEATYAGWRITDEVAQGGKLPWFLKKLGADPRWYRLVRK